MGWGALLQDWVTLASAGPDRLTQSEEGWLDLPHATDLVVTWTTKAVTGAPALAVETAPSCDADLFSALVTLRLRPHAQGSSRITFATASIVPARYLRWSLVTTGPSGATFRLWLTLTRTAR